MTPASARAALKSLSREEVASAVAMARSFGSIADDPLPPSIDRWPDHAAEVVAAAWELTEARWRQHGE
jgi:hypothetical protein